MPNNKKKGKKKAGDQAAAQQPARKSMGPVSKDGRMPEQDGRRFYMLLSILGAITVPKLNEEREAIRPGSEIAWYIDMARNSNEVREIVMIYILQHIDWIVEQLDDPTHDTLIRQIMGGRRLSEDDKAQIQSWKLHVEDDFVVVDHKDHEGMVFVQVGRSKQKDSQAWCKEDYHEPRAFVVQGLADSLQTLLARLAATFQQRNITLHAAHPEFKHLAMVHTALLPYMGGITYMTILSSPSSYGFFATPKDVHVATKLAINTFRALFPQSSDSTIATSAKLYRKFDLVEDAAICRLASDPLNQVSVPVAWKDVNREHEKKRAEAGTTPFMTNQVYWQPIPDRNSPELLQEKATGGPDSKPFCLEGGKKQIARERLVKDEDPCPFHKRFGETNESFDSCCKQRFLQRAAKSKSSLTKVRGHLLWDPLDNSEMDKGRNSQDLGRCEQ